jgi:hypothetical protein
MEGQIPVHDSLCMSFTLRSMADEGQAACRSQLVAFLADVSSCKESGDKADRNPCIVSMFFRGLIL